VFITSTSVINNNNKQTSNYDPLMMRFVVTLQMRTYPPFSGTLNVVQVVVQRIKGGKLYLRTPYKIKYKRTAHPP
jgi:hypothetical protein